MAIGLIIDTAGGANFQGFPLRNVGTLHVGGSGLPTAGYVGQFTGDLLVTEDLRVEGVAALVGAITTGLINGQTISNAANFTGTVAVAGAVNLASTLAVTGASTLTGLVTAPGGMVSGSTTGDVRISGGSTLVLGANIILYAESTPTVGGDILFRNGTTQQMRLNAAGDLSILSGALSVTGTSTLTGTVGIGNTPLVYVGLDVFSATLSGSTSKWGVLSRPVFGSGTTVRGRAVEGRADTAAAAFTMTEATAFYAANPTKGAGSTITTAYGLYVEAQTAGGANYAIYTNDGTVRLGDDVKIVGDIDFDSSSFITRSGTSHMRFLLSSTHFFQPITTAANSVFINDTSNANMTVGLTINQGANDDEAFALKSSDVAHGMTSIAETDTYGLLKKVSATTGGLLLRGISEVASAVQVSGLATDDNTTKSIAGLAPIVLNAAKKSGTSIGAVGADANLVAIRNNDSTVWIVDEDGDTWQSGGITATTGAFSGSLAWGGGSAIASSNDVPNRTIAESITGIWNFVNGLKAGGGATVKNILSATVVWDIPSTADGAAAFTDITVTGAAPGDPVFVGADNAGATVNLIFAGYVYNADTVRIAMLNKTGITVDPASQTVRAVVFKF